MSNGSLYAGSNFYLYSYFGVSFTGAQANPAVFNMNGGTASFQGFARLDNATINLNGGVLNFSPLTTAATVFNFNGGTLTGYHGSGAQSAALNVHSGGAVLSGGSMNFFQPFVHSGVVGEPAVDGGVTVTASGGVVFNAASTYTGPTCINGSLDVQNTTGSATGAGAVTVASGSVLS